MVKGQSLSKSKPTAKTKTKAKGGASSAGATQQCWNFWLDSPTPAAQNANVGTQVIGAPVRGILILVAQKDFTVLGLVPNDLEMAMMDAMQSTGGPLAGEVIAKNTLKTCKCNCASYRALENAMH